MRRLLLLVVFIAVGVKVFAQSEVGPDGTKLLWVLLFILALIVFLFLISSKRNTKTQKIKKPLFPIRKVSVDVQKDRSLLPDFLKLTVKNSGNTDVDMDRPLMIFDNFWLKRKFRIKGQGNYSFYPLYLEKGKTHTLDIDLHRFYAHDKKLKKYPKVKITIFDVKGKRLGSKSVFIRKTLLRF